MVAPWVWKGMLDVARGKNRGHTLCDGCEPTQEKPPIFATFRSRGRLKAAGPTRKIDELAEQFPDYYNVCSG